MSSQLPSHDHYRDKNTAMYTNVNKLDFASAKHCTRYSKDTGIKSNKIKR